MLVLFLLYFWYWWASEIIPNPEFSAAVYIIGSELKVGLKDLYVILNEREFYFKNLTVGLAWLK